MGNQQATRKVSFEREQTGLIAISDSVAQRLRNAEGALGSVKLKEDQKQTLEGTSSSSSLARRSSPNQHNEGLQHQYSSQHSQAQQEEHEKALSRLEEQWQERYKRLEGDSERLQQVATDEFNRAVKHVESVFESKSYAVGSADEQKAVMDCYKENITRSLKCSREADAFIKSIQDYKMGFLSKQVF